MADDRLQGDWPSPGSQAENDAAAEPPAEDVAENPLIEKLVESLKSIYGHSDEAARAIVARILAKDTQESQATEESEESLDPPASNLPIKPFTEENVMANDRAIQRSVTPEEVAAAEHYIFSLGHSREDAQRHAARIGHARVLQHQRDGKNPLAAKDED